jgi:hypothetical protein
MSKMGETIEKCVGFWEKVRFFVSPYGSNRSLQTLLYRITNSYGTAGARIAHNFQHPADGAFWTFNSGAI